MKYKFYLLNKKPRSLERGFCLDKFFIFDNEISVAE